MGDFHKYVIASDVDHFSQYPLSGPPPSTRHLWPGVLLAYMFATMSSAVAVTCRKIA